MKKSIKIISIVIAIIIGIYIISSIIAQSCITPQIFKSDIFNYNNCSANDECIIIQEGACNCAHDGKNVSINKKYKSLWLFINKKMCISLCNTIVSSDPSCSAEPQCINNKCELIPKN